MDMLYKNYDSYIEAQKVKIREKLGITDDEAKDEAVQVESFSISLFQTLLQF